MQTTQALAPEHSSRALEPRVRGQARRIAVLPPLFKQLFLSRCSLRTLITLVALRAVYQARGTARACCTGRSRCPCSTQPPFRRLHAAQATSRRRAAIMFLLGIGDILDEWTHKKSVADLAQTMSLNVDKVWHQTDRRLDVLVPLARRSGRRPESSVRTGGVIPLDGKVVCRRGHGQPGLHHRRAARRPQERRAAMSTPAPSSRRATAPSCVGKEPPAPAATTASSA